MNAFLNRFSPRSRTIAGGVALLLVGAAVGSALTLSARPIPAMAPAAPLPITTAAASATGFGDPLVTVRGEVMAVYGDRFTLKDASGQALVETGHRHAMMGQAPLVAAGQTVTVQGRQDGSTIRARFVVTPDGRAWAFGGHGHDRHGGGHDAPPPPPPPPPPPAMTAPTK